MLFNEPKLLKWFLYQDNPRRGFHVSVLFNEPKLLKYYAARVPTGLSSGFSALQRAEIAEIADILAFAKRTWGFSALQRAEIAEINDQPAHTQRDRRGFSALQRAEIAEITS